MALLTFPCDQTRLTQPVDFLVLFFDWVWQNLLELQPIAHNIAQFVCFCFFMCVSFEYGHFFVLFRPWERGWGILAVSKSAKESKIRGRNVRRVGLRPRPVCIKTLTPRKIKTKPHNLLILSKVHTVVLCAFKQRNCPQKFAFFPHTKRQDWSARYSDTFFGEHHFPNK